MDMLKKARNTAAGLLANKMYTCREIYDRLCRKGFEKDLAEQVVGEFVKAGYLDDRRYATMYIADEANLAAKGKFRIRQELIRKGVASSVIEEAMTEAEVNTEACLREYISQRSLCDNIHSRKDLQRLKARLARRGYSLGEINRCLGEYTFHFEESEWEE